jgi:fibronectin type 3 domain-containing protein
VLGEQYEYTVRTVAARAPSIESTDGPVREIEYLDTFAPPTPTGLVALAEEGRIRLLWERVEAPDLAGYRVYRQAGDQAPVELEREPGPATDHSDEQVRAGVAYTYRVVAVDDDGNESAPSDPATATPR